MTTNNMDLEQLDKPFELTTLCRQDLLNQGYTLEQVEKLDDDDMREIASKMGEAYMTYFWSDLEIILDSMGIKKNKYD